MATKEDGFAVSPSHGEAAEQQVENVLPHEHSYGPPGRDVELTWYRSRLNISVPGFKGLSMNYYAGLCAAFAALGGMVFGYEHVFQLLLSSHELIPFQPGSCLDYTSHATIPRTLHPSFRNRIRGWLLEGVVDSHDRARCFARCPEPGLDCR